MAVKKNIAVIGAGLVGSLLSIYLTRRGHSVTIYERRGDMRREKVDAGRSINLALSDRGILALEEVGIAKEVLDIAIPMHGRLIHSPDRSTVFQPYGKQGQFINSVSRGLLNEKLMSLAEKNGVRIAYNHRCNTIDWNKNEINFAHGSNHSETVKADVIFAADGAYSAARLQHMLNHPAFDYHQYYIDCAYKEISIPAGPDNQFLFEKHALHIWPRKDFMLIALPNTDGSFTGTLFYPVHGELSMNNLNTADKIESFFQASFPDVASLIPDLAKQFKHNPTSSLVTVKCFPWVREDKFALIGDAAHAIVPFFGQGMNAGFEDCSVLDKLMDQYNDDWKSLLNDFQQLRKPDADAIADLAVNNFTEMREKTADPKFLLQKKIEAKLHEDFPDQWIPAYSQVTFSPHIRYSDALKNAKKQESIMQEFMQRPDVEQLFQNGELEKMIVEKVKSSNQ